MDRGLTVSATFTFLPPPTSLTATAVSSGQIDLSWPDSTDVETGFQIERKTYIGGVYFPVASVGANTTTYSDTGLKADTIYYYRVKSVNAEVHGGYSAEASATTYPLLPKAPYRADAQAISSSRIVLSWKGSAVNETGFKIERKSGYCASSVTWSEVATVPADSTMKTFYNLLSDAAYSFRVRAYNAAGDSEYTSCTAARTGPTGAPDSPTGLIAFARSSEAIKLAWDDKSADETSFNIYKQAGTGEWTLLTTVPQDTTQYIDTNAQGNSLTTSYKYYVEACNEQGCSPQTSVANVPFKPRHLSAGTNMSDRVNLTWTDTNDNKYTGVNIFRKAGLCNSSSPWVNISNTKSHDVTYADTGLAEGATYSYKIRAYTLSSSMPTGKGVSFFSNCSSASTVVPSLLSIVVKPASPRVLLGKTQQFKAIGTYSDGSTRDLSSIAIWTSSDRSVLRIISKGVASASALGYATVTATFGGLKGNAAAVTTDMPTANIILLLTDDMSIYDLAYLPNVKALLSDQGLEFTNAFVSTSLCCPSRSSILRGQYVHNHQVLNNVGPTGGYEKFQALGNESSTIATWLQDAGYRTVLIGKYLNGYPGANRGTAVPEGWDEWYGLYLATNFYYNYKLNENGRIVQYGAGVEDYQTDVFAGKAKDFIQRAAVDLKPFFMYLTPVAPPVGKTGPLDEPLFPAPVPAFRHRDEFPDVTVPRLPSFNEEDLSDKPATMRALPLLTPIEFSEIDMRYRLRLQSLLAVDEMLAGIIDTLRATGQLDRTYIIFSSDNGYHLGEHRIAKDKGTCYEEAVRVPLVVRGPGVAAGAKDDHLVLNTDFAPTFLELVPMSLRDQIDGRSLAELLRGGVVPDSQWRQAILEENWASSDQVLSFPHRSAVRTKDFKYIRWEGTGEIEFYDLTNDPYELRSLHNTASPDLLQGYANWLDLLDQCAGQGCRDAENLSPPQ